jgi:predicted ArsR family transcriptional regulator
MKTKARPLPLVEELSIPLDHDFFLRSLLRELAGTLQDVVGLKEASGFMSVVGQHLGDQVNSLYKNALGTLKLSREQVAAVLVDFKRRIRGDFHIIEADDEKIVLGNRACPFGDKVLDRPTLCMMTSNIFGILTADNLGYARVVIERSIAQGHPDCRVVIYLKPAPPEEARPEEKRRNADALLSRRTEAAPGREYFKG